MKVLVAGGAGFVGLPTCRILAERGHDVTVASRTPDTAELPSQVETVALDVTDPDLTEAVSGHDAVVNLVALPSHRDPRGRTHESVHRDGTRNLVRASEETDVERFVQMSGLGVESDVDTAYFRAKRQAERIVRDSDLDWVVYRPSVVFGDGCAFLPFVERVTPPIFAPLPGGGTMELQPMWVEDLVPMLADGVEDERRVGEIYELGGPERLTFAEIVERVNDGVSVVSVPNSLASVGFSVAERVPGVPFGRDQFRVFAADNVVPSNDVTAFGVSEDDLRSLTDYLDK
ncbi:NAD(P)H-binding protein [Halorussus halophilus]|uniref:NAD(P)H-binding protein n=1 Tax=Halorussus halophilus TaxID=2650975 RepID=UPI0013013F4B|nr:NAD(P)H-binding protein [Halorussus halophilus]